MGLAKYHPANMKRRLIAMQERWQKDAALLEEMGFRCGDNPDGNEGPFGETLRNLYTAIAEIHGAIAMSDDSFIKRLKTGRALTATETADALFFVQEEAFTDSPSEVSQKIEYEPCGGCGATQPSERCIGCFHDFGQGSSDWVYQYTRTK